MRSTMMDVPLLVPSLLQHAARYHGDTEVVSRTTEGPIHRSTYAEVWQRCQQLAHALAARGLQEGDRVGTLAWNGHRHLEIYYGAAVAGMVCHTINPRLFPEQLAFIINHAADRVLCVELSFVALIESLVDRLPAVEAIVVMTDRAHMPPSALPNLLCYEELLEGQPTAFDSPPMQETSGAGLCYTSGTTGDPKGVLYSHRSTVLHAMAICQPDVFALGATSVVMPVVPMFHVNAWGLPYAAPMVGAKLVLPGPKLDPASLHELIVSEGVTRTAGVPTVWLALLDWLAARGENLGALERVIIGGSACPPVMSERFRALGVDAMHAWGMTETNPLGLANRPKAQQAAKAEAFAAKQGRPLFGVQVRVVDDAVAEIAHDGVAFGRMQVRGPWVTARYFEAPGGAVDGWFETGDIVTVDPGSYVQIVDRSKDVIKSGGEWISSVDLENIAVAHPAVQEAAVVARPDERWAERPLLVVVPRPGAALTEADMLAFYEGKVARWWVPDAVVFAAELPHTATGKLLKSRIRELYCGPGRLAG